MIKYIAIFAALAAGLLSLSSCSKDDETTSYQDNLKKGEEYMAANALREGVVTTSTGLQYEILQEGNEDGRTPSIFNSVRCHYLGYFIDGEVFDSSYRNVEPVTFSLSGVITGWTEGLQYMKEGAKYRFVIPYYLAYGPNGYYTIPPYSTLIFEVELIEVL